MAREFAQNAIDSHGRSMIIFGAGICQWYHADTTYRAILALLNLTGCQGRNGGGWAHYVGQEKARPLTGLTNMANALDWSRPPRHMIGTGFGTCTPTSSVRTVTPPTTCSPPSVRAS